MKNVSFVPIKLNSSRLKNKNIADLGGKPLCYYVFESLRRANIKDIYVYCSDEKIREYVPEYVKFLKRDKILDYDETKGIEIYKAFRGEIKADYYILAHATSPFIKPRSILDGINAIENGGFDSAFSAKRVQTFAWYEGKPINYILGDVPRTQEISPIYVETSGFYMFKSSLVDEGRRIGENPFIVEVGSIEAIDIDEAEDLEVGRAVLNYISHQ